MNEIPDLWEPCTVDIVLAESGSIFLAATCEKTIVSVWITFFVIVNICWGNDVSVYYLWHFCSSYHCRLSMVVLMACLIGQYMYIYFGKILNMAQNELKSWKILPGYTCSILSSIKRLFFKTFWSSIAMCVIAFVFSAINRSNFLGVFCGYLWLSWKRDCKKLQ